MEVQINLSKFFPPPTAHEVWVRNHIPRGAHYDTADDGPETDLKYMLWVARTLRRVALVNFFDADWLDKHSVIVGGIHDEMIFLELSPE